TPDTAALPPGVQFDHSTATAECATCHVSGSSSWAGGRFHLAGSTAPSSCVPCHQGERPASTAGWRSATYPDSPFDYGSHGAGLDCASCHVAPAAGTETWTGGA